VGLGNVVLTTQKGVKKVSANEFKKVSANEFKKTVDSFYVSGIYIDDRDCLR